MTGNSAAPGSSSGGDARPGLNPLNVRQWQDTARNLNSELQGLRRDLQNAGVASRELTSIDDVVRALREMDSVKMTQDPRAVQALTAAALEKLKRFDLDLRKRVDTSSSQLFLAGTEDVPKAYQPLVNEYSRALSKKPGAATPAPATPKGGGK